MAPKIDFDVKQLTGFLTRKLGPLPAWGWGAIAAGGLLLFRQVRTQSMSGQRSTSPLLSTSAGQGALFATTSGGGALPASGFNGGGVFKDDRFSVSTPSGFFFEGPGSLIDNVRGFFGDEGIFPILPPIITPTTPPIGTPTPLPPPPPPVAPTPHVDPPPVTRVAAKVYTIVRGDTLNAIARRFNTTLSTLRRLNPNLFDSRHRGGDLIFPGEQVRLP